MKAEWTVVYIGASVPLSEVLEGVLNKEDGSVRFVEKGSYALKAMLTAEIGRT